MSDYSVRAVRCDYLSDDEEVFQALSRATTPLKDTWERLSKAKRQVEELQRQLDAAREQEVKSLADNPHPCSNPPSSYS